MSELMATKVELEPSCAAAPGVLDRGTFLEVVPINIADARRFVNEFHRHHKAPLSAKFALGLEANGELAGVAMVGRPVARMLDDGRTAEVTRCCVREGVPNGCSMLYGAAWRCARAMGYKRLVTYTLDTEPGSSLAASNWRVVGQAGGGSWSRPSRTREDNHPTQRKMRWEIP
jgi:alkylated DNA nucleotide flippase Atl1